METPDHLQTGVLHDLLRALPASASDRVAEIMVPLYGRMSFASRHLPRSLNERNLRGHDLVPDIVTDLSGLAAHDTGPTPDYRTILQTVARRHGIVDDGTRSPAEVERELLRAYLPAPRPSIGSFRDRGSNEAWRRLGYIVPIGGWLAYSMSPNWTAVTAAVLEIAAQRRMALIRVFRDSLGA